MKFCSTRASRRRGLMSPDTSVPLNGAGHRNRRPLQVVACLPGQELLKINREVERNDCSNHDGDFLYPCSSSQVAAVGVRGIHEGLSIRLHNDQDCSLGFPSIRNICSRLSANCHGIAAVILSSRVGRDNAWIIT